MPQGFKVLGLNLYIFLVTVFVNAVFVEHLMKIHQLFNLQNSLNYGYFINSIHCPYCS